jgi:hypothetical protein
VRATEVVRDRGLEATSATTDQVALEALGLLQLVGPSEDARAETAPGWTTWGAVVRGGRPGGLATLLQRSHAGTMISVRFRRSLRSTPSDHSDGLWGSSRYAAPESSSGSRPTNGAPAPPKRPGFSRAAEAAARPEAGGPRAGQVRPPSWTCQAGRRCPPERACPPRWAAERLGQRTDRSDEPSALRVPVRRLLKPS